MAEQTVPVPAVKVGVDVTAVADVEASIAAFGPRYLRRLFTDHEIESCTVDPPIDAVKGASGRVPESLAARFAAKEAVLKVLEPTGARPPWRDIEIVRRENGACRIRLHRKAATLADARGVLHIGVSLSHEAGLAVAVVAATCSAPALPTATTAQEKPDAACSPSGGLLHTRTSHKNTDTKRSA